MIHLTDSSVAAAQSDRTNNRQEATMADSKKVTPQRPGAGGDEVPLSRVTDNAAEKRDTLSKTALKKTALKKTALKKTALRKAALKKTGM